MTYRGGVLPDGPLLERLTGRLCQKQKFVVAKLNHRVLVDNCRLREVVANGSDADLTSGKPTFRKREGFRAPVGVRKSPRTEPAGHTRFAMGFSGFG